MKEEEKTKKERKKKERYTKGCEES
jgi:hypothetical protein